MAFLRDVSDRFWSYVSPRKTQQRREKPFKIPALPSHVKVPLSKQIATPEARDMSPESRIKIWHTRTPSPQSDVDMDATLLPPSPPTSTRQSPDDLEGDTLLPSSPVSPSYDKTGYSADEVDANEDTTVVDDGTYMNQYKKYNIDEERKRRDKQGRELRDAGWSEDAVFLFQKLGMRGFEPLLPIDWIDDFETLPEDLFTAKLDKAFIKPALGTDYHAQVALSNLFDLGSLARDAWHTRAPRRTPAYHIKRAVQKYTKWAMKDGEIDHIWPELPLFEIVTWGLNVHSSDGEKRMIEKLSNLHARWREALQAQTAEGRLMSAVPEVPTLHGVTASHTVMAFVSYAPPTEENEQPQLRLIAMFDFGKEGYDVWNSLAIAIFVVHCRNRMMQLKECLPEPELSTEEDPDI
ncbi:Nn.00g115210.m01.CDS01 [Neocucurbitaria sp. VM-36]